MTSAKFLEPLAILESFFSGDGFMHSVVSYYGHQLNLKVQFFYQKDDEFEAAYVNRVFDMRDNDITQKVSDRRELREMLLDEVHRLKDDEREAWIDSQKGVRDDGW